MTILICWQLIIQGKLLPTVIFPTPWQIIACLPELHFENALVRNVLVSLKLNILGNFEAILLAVPLGFIIGLFPVFRAVFRRYIIAIRYLPLPTLLGVFIAIFGIYDNMKIQFLALAVFVYLLPAVIQRINEVLDVYIQTALTMGANKWQMIRHVFIPATLPLIWKDIVNLVAISWTYITIAEVVNASGGGIGALCFTVATRGRIDKVFAVLIIVILVGMMQDKILSCLGNWMFGE
jgi:NitT/TauT family transport system permease protein